MDWGRGDFTGNRAIQGFYDQRFAVVQQFIVQGAGIVCLSTTRSCGKTSQFDRVLGEKVDTPDSARRMIAIE